MCEVNSFFDWRHFNNKGNAVQQGKPRGKLTSKDTASTVVSPKNCQLILHAFVNGWREDISILANSAAQWQQTGRATGWGPNIQTVRALGGLLSTCFGLILRTQWPLIAGHFLVYPHPKATQSTTCETDLQDELKCDKVGTTRLFTSEEHSWSERRC